MEDEKKKHNHTGQQPSDVPTERLVHPPSKKRTPKIDRESGFNSTGKDPNLGSRNTTGR